MRTRSMFRGWIFVCLAGGLSCTAAPNADHAANQTDTTQTLSSALTSPILNDFEDGTTQGWFGFGNPTVANSTEVANTGTHSLKTTNRTAGFNGPGTSLTNQLTPGITYSVSVATRLAAGEVPTTLKVTVQRTMSDGTTSFDQVVPSTSVTADAWVTLSGNYTIATSNLTVTGLIMYVESASATASYYIDTFSLQQASTNYDFEDGTTQGWFGFGSPTVANSTDVANTGTHSLKTTNRAASFNGPGVNLLGQLTKGTYQITVSARMVLGQPAANIQPTFQRVTTGGVQSFDTVMTLSNVTDQAWVTGTALYTLSTDNTTLIFYVQTQSGTASYYIDSVSITLVAPPAPIPPPNTTGSNATFESGTLEGWASRTGGETVANSTADAHTGTHSLLTSNRTATFQGPALNVTNVMFNGSRYFVSIWAKLAPGAPDTQLRVSLQRNAGTITTFHTVVGNTTVTANAWVRLQATYDVALPNSSLTLYVESNSGTPSFYIDDASITFLQPAVAERNIPSVYQTMAPFFPIVGAAVIPADITGEPGVLLAKHFNSMTSGNDMKWDATEPTEGNFVFTNADAQVSFAKANSMHVRGHTLVWHNQTPAWVFNDVNGNPMTATPENRALLISRMQRHITTVMQHFGNDVPIWDVVNEPVDPAQPDGYRRSPWFNIIGPQYIEIALQAARAANPTAKLYINDFDTTNPAHRDPLLAIVRDLKSRGIPLDGFGHQMHNNIEYPPVQSIIDSINLFATTGVEQSVTELDYSIYGFSGPNSVPFTSYTDIPASRHTSVGYSYRNFLQAIESTGKIVSLTIWGTSDDKSWLTSSTKVDAPLLFDPSLKKKPAYWAFVDPLQLPGADLSTKLDVASMTVPAGQAFAYTITVTNNADQNQPSFAPTDDDLPATNTTMTMAIPSHTAFLSLSTPAGWSCSAPIAGAGGQVSCTIPSLAVGASGQFTLTVAQNDCAQPDASAIVASATVTSATADPNPAPNNTDSKTVQVSNPPPVITANGALDTTVECHTSYSDAGATATDACDGPVSVTAASTVNVNVVGTYGVTYTAADTAGGQATPVVRTVHVADTRPPVVSLNGASPMPAECATSFTDPGATASDSCAGTLPVSETGAVDIAKVGSYTLLYAATDPSGNTGSATRVVNVADTTPPQLSVVASTTPLTPANHSYRTFTITNLVTAASDTCDGSVGTGSVVITQVTSDEPQTGSGDGTTNDVVIASDCRSVQVRAERDNDGNGRVYTVSLRVKDASGNSTTTSVKVTAPTSDGGAAIDNGPAYTVASACQ